MPASPLMVNDLSNAASNDDAVTVSFPVPALMVNEPVGLENVTDSLKFESIVMFAPAASVSVIVSAPPLNVKTRSVALRLSMIGSRPVYDTTIVPSISIEPSLAFVKRCMIDVNDPPVSNSESPKPLVGFPPKY